MLKKKNKEKYSKKDLVVSLSIGEEIKVQFTGTKLIHRLSYKYQLGNLQVSVKK